MIYLLDGIETYKLKEKKKALLKEVVPDNIISIDAGIKSDFSWQNVIQKCSTVSLFEDKRIVVLNHPYFLKKTAEVKTIGKKIKLDDSALLIQYCENPIENTDLIIYCSGYDIDKRTKEAKILLSFIGKSVVHLHFGSFSIWELEEKIDSMIQMKKYHFTKEAREELSIRIAGNTTEFYKAFDKLDLYGEKEFDLTAIRHLIPTNPEIEIWTFTNAFIAGNMKQSMQSLNDLTLYSKYSYQSLVIILASSLRRLYYATSLYECGYKFNQIEKMMGTYKVDKLIQSAQGKKSNLILIYLHQLAQLDQAIKDGTINAKEGFENFLIRNLEKYAIN